MPKRGCIFIGFLLTAASVMLVGTSPTLRLPESAWCIGLGLAIYGLGAAMTIIPIFPEMLEGVEEAFPEKYGT